MEQLGVVERMDLYFWATVEGQVKTCCGCYGRHGEQPEWSRRYRRRTENSLILYTGNKGDLQTAKVTEWRFTYFI